MIDKPLIAAVGVLGVLAVVSMFVPAPSNPAATAENVSAFQSADDFRAYLQQSEAAYGSGYAGGGDVVRDTASLDEAAEFDRMESGAPQAGGDAGDGGTTAEPSRSSTTNVQVQGIDEPDIVKNTDQTIFYARNDPRYYWRDDGRQANTTVVDAWPAANASVTGNVPKSGNLLLHEDTLLVLSDSYRDNSITGYDVSDETQPVQEWNAELNGSIETARLYNGDVYVVLRERVDRDTPCPIRPMTRGGADAVTVPCDRIYHPSNPAPADVTYTVLKLDPQSGDVQDTVSFVGSSRNSVVSMSENGVYVTYTRQKSQDEAFYEFWQGPGNEMLDQQARNRISELEGYNISTRAKEVELQQILENYRDRLDRDARKTFETRVEHRFGNWTEEHMREFHRTGITKISVPDLAVAASGNVAGEPLNQFALDEYQGNLRIATTVDPVDWRGKAENDVYVLDENLQQTGEVTGMGVNERVYSVRFIDDKGYVVTFRRIDPFHVLDLSDPSSPTLEGELKLPGYSSYLHPIGDDRILGIGREEGNVKAVVFDVSDPTNPQTGATYRLDEGWSEIEETHRAFLHDPRHSVVFIPARNGGYVLNYEDGLDLETAVDMKQAERALYIDDYLYVIGEYEIAVLDETTWERVHTVDLGEPPERKPHPLPEPRIEEERMDDGDSTTSSDGAGDGGEE